MKKKTQGYLLQIIVLIALVVIGIWRHQNRTYHEMQQAFVMDTLFEIEAESKRSDLAAILDSCITMTKAYEYKFSAYADSGDVVRINDFAGKGILTIDKEIAKLIKRALFFTEKTKGKYDITIGNLADLWDINQKKIPSETQIKEALKHTGYGEVILNGNVLSMPKGFKINLGSIAKGYVVDKIQEYLEKMGIEKYIINAGGDLFIKSDKQEIIGIQHPRGDRGTVIDKINVQNGAVVSSGDYERFFEVDGVRYHHIIDAKSGYPANKCVSVTVICDDATTADAFATSAFLVEPVQAVKMADSIDNAAVIIYFTGQNGNLERLTNDRAKQYLEEDNG